MANAVKWTTAVSRTTGIAAASLNAGANLLGSEINNAINRDRFATVEVHFSCAVAPTANSTIEVYLIYAVPQSIPAIYEDGDASTDPTITPVGFVAARAVTGLQRVAVKDIPLVPFRFKILLKSELDQNASNVGVSCYTHSEEIQ